MFIRPGFIVAIRLTDRITTGIIHKVDSFSITINEAGTRLRFVISNWVHAWMNGNIIVHSENSAYHKTIVHIRYSKSAPSIIKKVIGYLFGYYYRQDNKVWKRRQLVRGLQYRDGFFIPARGQKWRHPLYFDNHNKIKSFLWRRSNTK